MIFRMVHAGALAFLMLSSLTALQAQKANDDPVLFSVGGDDVHLSEFRYVYEKSNGNEANYSKKSVEEFLDLYEKFKLKVADARSLGMEKDPQMEAELAQYRNQLADKYMSDDAVQDRLTKELYDRMKWDIDVSHILQRVTSGAPEYVREKAIEKLKEAEKALASGVEFSSVAKKYSQDRSVMKNGGHLGYRRAKLPDGFYDLETLMYNTPPGEVAGPVQSRLGYHLIKVNGRKPDPGNIKVAHILIRNPRPGKPDTAKQAIDHIYAKLKAGADFGEMAQKYSEDKNNRRQNGYLGEFKTGTYDPAFEEAAFAIPEDGGFSPPVHTEYGWHIIQRISLKSLGSYEDEKKHLETLVRRDSRYKLAQEALITRIKEEENFQKIDVSNEKLLGILTKDVFQLNWKIPQTYENIDLFQIRDSVYDLQDFINYLAANPDARYQRALVKDEVAAAGKILDKYIDYELLEWEKAHLEEKYPEFREIMREYREGIMLFEISKEKIWDRAGQDTSGLRAYYEQNKMDYHTPRTIIFDHFTVNTANPQVLHKVEKLIKKKKPEKVLKKLNKAAEVVKYSKQTEKEDEFASQFQIKEDQLQTNKVFQNADKEDHVTMFAHIKQIDAGEPLDFKEARGAIMSDYQKYLEDQWIAELQKKFDLEINDSVLQSIIKS